MKLYYAPGACSLADHIALIEAGLPHELVKVDLKAKKTADGRDFTAINPKGYVPALELDDGEVLTENIAILSYVAAEAKTLEPLEGLPHFRALETTAFISTELHKNFKPFFNPAASDAEKDEARAMLGRRFATLAGMIGGAGFLVGGALSIADCYAFVMLTWAMKNGIDLPPPLPAYHAALKARPGFAQALAEEGLS